MQWLFFYEKAYLSMKKSILFAFALIFGTFFSAMAQLSVGVKGGSNSSTVVYRASAITRGPQAGYLDGINGGMVVRYMTHKNLGLQLDLLYSEKGWAMPNGIVPILRTRLNYLEIPIQSHFSFGGKFRVFVNAGPHLGFVLSKQQNLNQGEVIDPATQQPIDLQLNEDYIFIEERDNKTAFGVGGSLGFSYTFSFGTFQVEGGMRQDFSNIMNRNLFETPRTSQNQVLFFNVGYLWNFPDWKK